MPPGRAIISGAVRAKGHSRNSAAAGAEIGVAASPILGTAQENANKQKQV
jgi:hypothetical protein